MYSVLSSVVWPVGRVWQYWCNTLDQLARLPIYITFFEMKCEYFKNVNQPVYHPLMLLKPRESKATTQQTPRYLMSKKWHHVIGWKCFVDTVMFVCIGIQIEYSW